MGSRDQGLGIRGWGRKNRGWGLGTETPGFGFRISGFGALLGLGFLVISAVGFAQDLPGSSTEPKLGITVRVYNLANVGESTVVNAEKEAARILGEAGAPVAWINCPMDPKEAEANPVCRRPGTPATIVFRIVARLNGDGEGASPFSTLGSSVVLDRPGHGTLAAVSYHRVSAMTAPRRLGASHAPYLVLGLAMAHEIGHLLLGIPTHSPTGLMRAVWNSTDLQRAALGHLSFSSQEAEAIRAEVRDRMDHDQAANAGQLIAASR